MEQTYEMKNIDDLSKVLLGAIRDVRLKKLDIESGVVIAQLSDKYIKARLAKVIEERHEDSKRFNKIDLMLKDPKSINQ